MTATSCRTIGFTNFTTCHENLMIRTVLVLLLGLWALAAPALAQQSSLPKTSTVTVSPGTGPAGCPPTGYCGPGDLATYTHWYGVRAYSSTTTGRPLVNVCVSGTCQDLVSNSSGDIQSATVNGKTCPSPRTVYPSTCFVAKWYDQVGSATLAQSSSTNQPWLVAGAIPIVGSNRACVYFQDPGYAT